MTANLEMQSSATINGKLRIKAGDQLKVGLLALSILEATGSAIEMKEPDTADQYIRCILEFQPTTVIGQESHARVRQPALGPC
jgi:hypothetical protein